MGLAASNAIINIQDGGGAVAALSNNGTGLYTPGAYLTFSLQSTSGIQQWRLKFICPEFPWLHQQIREWYAGQANSIVIPMPPYPTGSSTDYFRSITVISEVTDGVSSIAYATNVLQTKGGNAVPMQHIARGVITTALGAYTNSNGVLTENANGAIGSVADGLTIAVGDILLLPPGIAASAVDAGLYQVTALGGASAKFVLTSAPDWVQGAVVQPKTEILVSEGTLFGGSTWVITNTGQTNLIGTASFTIYPRQVSQSITLVSGTKTVANVPIVSATTTNVVYNRTTANTTASTIIYATIGGITPGALGTATFAFQAAVAAGTINTADISTLTITIINPV